MAAIDYRLAPEHPCPAAIDDALAAWADLRERVSPSRAFIAGDSAGTPCPADDTVVQAHLPAPARIR